MFVFIGFYLELGLKKWLFMKSVNTVYPSLDLNLELGPEKLAHDKGCTKYDSIDLNIS